MKIMQAGIFSLITVIVLSVSTSNAQSIEYDDAYSVYITKHLQKSKDFYVKWLDFDVVFESTWFIYFQSKGNNPVSFALIDVKHPSSPPTYGAFDGKGSFLTLQVKDAEQVYKKLKDANAPIAYHLKKEDWGQIRFGLTDPNGLYIDIVQQVVPVAGYWEKYLPKK